MENTEYQKKAWVIITNRDGFETCVHETLERRGNFWFNWAELWRPNGDVFNTELAARNEMEKRLYERFEKLRKHREELRKHRDEMEKRLYERFEKLRKHRDEMSMALVGCAPPIGKSKTAIGGE